jgi:CelD/BcsL family acetyltransferase involved in cellulose biosynthesis
LVDDRTDADYRLCLEQAKTPLGQHAPGYLAALAECPHEEPLRVVAYEGDEPVGAVAGMLYSGGPVRMVESLPYGYGGVISSLEGEARRGCMALLCEALVQVARSADARLLSIQTPPFPDGPDAYREAFRPDFELRSFVQYVDLPADFGPADEPPPGEHSGYRGHVRRNHRRNIARAEASGVTADPSHSEACLRAYCLLQEKRMAEVGGRPRPRAFLDGIYRHMLPEGTGWLFCARKDGKVLSATAVIGVRDVLDVLLLCMDSSAEPWQPNALLCYRAMEWAAEREFKVLNFQSSLKRGDSLYHWKSGWGAVEAPVSIMTRVIGDTQPILRLPPAELREAYTYHYVLPYPVLEAAQAGRPIDSPDLRVLEKGA